MNTRSRITLSTVLGLTLVGLALGTAQAQTGTNRKVQKQIRHEEAKHEEMLEDGMMDDYNWPVPTPINYPRAAPGGVHLYHWTSFGHEALAPDSAYSTLMDHEYHHDKMLRERLKNEEANWTPEQKKLMREPAPINYPRAAPGGLHLHHWTDFSRETIGDGSATEKRMDNEEEKEKITHDRMRHEEAMMTPEEKKLMREPAPINYPFAAPGGLHLYHYTDYSEEGISEGSATEKQEENEEMREKKMKQDRMSK